MLGQLADQSYYFLCNLSKKISDYQTQTTAVAAEEEVGDIDEYGVNVEFDESGLSNNNYFFLYFTQNCFLYLFHMKIKLRRMKKEIISENLIRQMKRELKQV